LTKRKTFFRKKIELHINCWFKSQKIKKMTKEEFILELSEIGAIKFGDFTLKSGLHSPFYFDLRDMVSYPYLLNGISELVAEEIKDYDYELVTGIPYTALPIASLVADKLNKPLVYMRKEEKAYGTKNNVIGKFEKGSKCIVIDDLITTGDSKIETAKAYEKEGVEIKDFVVVIDRSSNGKEILGKDGYNLISLISLEEILEILLKNNRISAEKATEVREYTKSLDESAPKSKKEANNSKTQKLVNLIKEKQSNLILSLDVDNQKEFFEILDKTASEIVMLKTHVDIIDDYDENFVPKLQEYAKKYNFLIFEDRKFADIGNTVKKQFQGGVYKISEWADFITVHMVPGHGILEGLFDGVDNVSSFVLARMSSAGNLINETYSRKAIDISSKYNEVVSGFIGHGLDVEDIKKYKNKFPEGYLLLMPGVQLEAGKDNMGQQYVTVEDAITGGADCVIVGRGIYGKNNPEELAKVYRERAWKAYSDRIGK
jgi:uridine monophosphate synthetase